MLAKSGIGFAEYQSRFNATIETQAKTLVFLMIPMFAVGLSLAYLAKREYLVKHLVFATHFFSFYLLLLSGVYLLVRLTVRALFAIGARVDLFTDLVMTSVIMSVVLVYLIFALRRVYGQSWTMIVVKSVVLSASLMVIIQAFRFILFFTTFYSI